MSAGNGKTVAAVLLAAGGSSRMGSDSNGEPINKMLLKFSGLTPIAHCVRAFNGIADEMVIVCSASTKEETEKASRFASCPVKIVMGGELRQDSVLNGINAASSDIVAIHDCARCLVTKEIILRAVEAAKETGSGVAAVRARDTLRREMSGETVDREGLICIQTPQCFSREQLLKAYEMPFGTVTDDAAVWQNAYGCARLTKGSLRNQKLTEAEDIPFFECFFSERKRRMRIGMGEDTHRLKTGRELILGGVHIPFALGLDGHSDADALIHAVVDAMLGAAALGDIGAHFPDTDPRYKGISSLLLLKEAARLVTQKGYRISNIDATITAQAPKLAPHIPEMRKKIAGALDGVGYDDVSVKATTPEHLGPEGSLLGVTCRAVVLLESIG